MNYKLSSVEVLEWGDPHTVFNSVKDFSINDRLPRTLSFSYQINNWEGDRLPVSVTWTHVIMDKENRPLFKYVGITRANVERCDPAPSLEQLTQFIHNMFFQFTFHFYGEWQQIEWETGIADGKSHDIDVLTNAKVFDLADAIRMKLAEVLVK